MRALLSSLALCGSIATGAAASPDSLSTAAPDSARVQAPAAPSPVVGALDSARVRIQGPGGAIDLTVHAVRLDGPITLDGALNEPVWRNAIPATRFLQRDPVEGPPATERTEVRVAYDDDAIYIGARMFDAHPDSIVARLVRRDNTCTADRFFVFFDPFHDRRSGYYFGINAAGVLYDGTLFNDGWDDNSWDGVWDGRVRIDAQGWTAELRIPFCQLRFNRTEHPVWGINFKREITRRSEVDYLVYPPRKEAGFVSRFPDLVGMDGVRGGRAIELLPYVTGKAEYLVHDANDPFNDGSRYQPSGGADLRMGVGGNLTLNATINPDFGQVEVDPSIVNLTDTESYYQEKRPFFVENSRVFSFGNEGANDYWGFNWPDPTFFYSRRIGRNPQGTVPDSQFVDEPTATRILGAAKLTGKPAAGWNFGTLHALTALEDAKLFGSGQTTSWEVEPLSYYGVVRGEREFNQSRHGLGFMGSLVARHFDTADLRDQLSAASVQAGLDGWHFLDRRKTYVLSGWAMTSYVSGTAARITALQTSSLHYLQRPDRRNFTVDSSATSLGGYGARLWLNKQSGKVLLNSAIGFMNPRFDVNDMGYQSRSDLVNAHFGMGYQWTETNNWRKYASTIGAVFQSRDFDNNVINQGVWGKYEVVRPNNADWNMSASYDPQTHNNRRTRGGPLTLNLPSWNSHIYLETDPKSKFYYYFESGVSFAQSGTQDYWFGPGVEWKPVSSITLRVGPNFERYIEDAQYVETQPDPLATSTYGQRYVFATLDQSTLSTQIRINLALTPRLSIQTYVQPLISSGNYYAYKELARPGSYDWNHYGQNGSTIDEQAVTIDPDGAGPAAPFSFSNPDFNVRTLVGNSVVRWEYMPGSTLYLVWTQNRSASDGVSGFDWSNSLDRVVNVHPSNTFLAKITYYISR